MVYSVFALIKITYLNRLKPNYLVFGEKKKKGRPHLRCKAVYWPTPSVRQV